MMTYWWSGVGKHLPRSTNWKCSGFRGGRGHLYVIDTGSTSKIEDCVKDRWPPPACSRTVAQMQPQVRSSASEQAQAGEGGCRPAAEAESEELCKRATNVRIQVRGNAAQPAGTESWMPYSPGAFLSRP